MHNEDKTIYSETEVDNAKAMIEVLRKDNNHLSQIVNKLLSIGKAEVSFFCRHKANDLVQYDSGLFKIRPDLYTFNKIIDWKTVGGNGYLPEKFSKIIIDYGYDFQAAFYQYVIWMITGHWKAFYWIVQDKEPPYDFNIISADGWAFEIIKGEVINIGPGARKMLKALDLYLYCLEKNQWPDSSIYIKPDYLKNRIAKANVPLWYKNQEINYYF